MFPELWIPDVTGVYIIMHMGQGVNRERPSQNNEALRVFAPKKDGAVSAAQVRFRRNSLQGTVV